MAENIGTAYLNIEVRTDNMQAGLSTAKRSVSDMSQQAQAEYNKLTAAQKRTADSALNFAKTMGLAREEVRALNVEQRIGGQLGKELAATIRAQAAAQQVATAGMAVSAKQTQAALRGVPAQITDIVTSLQGGQAPLTVLLQQGGQLRDVFGGIRPAAAALGSTILGMVNPLTIAGAAAVGLAVAFEQGRRESQAFQDAVALTGGAIGTTVGGLEDMARAMSVGATTQHEAAAALAEVARTGAFAGDQIGLDATAAVDMERATGQAVSDTVKEFEKLRDEPVKAVLELNDKYHFLTLAVYEQIKALEEEGRSHDAARVASEAYATAISERAVAVSNNLGTLQHAWRGVGIMAKWAWDQMLDVGRPTGGREEFDKLTAKLQELQNPSNAWSYGHLGPVGSEKRNAEIQRVRDRMRELQDANVQGIKDAAKAAAQAQTVVDKAASDADVARYRTEQERVTKEKERIRGVYAERIANARRAENADLVRQLEADQRAVLAGLDAKVAKKAKQPRAISDRDSGQSLLDQITKQIALYDQEAESGERATAGDRLRIQVNQLLADATSKVSAATRAKMEAGLQEIEQQEQYREIAEMNAYIDGESARQRGEIAEKAERQADAIAALADDMQFELSMLGKSAAEQTRMIALRQAGTAATAEQRAEIVALAEELQRSRETQAVLDDLKFSAEDLFSGFIDGSGSAGDAFEDFTKRIRKLAAQMLAEKAIQWLFSSAMFGNSGPPAANDPSVMPMTTNAKGGVYSSASLSAFSGQVVSAPTVFAFAKGAGVMGEAGPEAILPLRRGPDGKLGVTASGGGGGIRDIVINAPAGSNVRTEERPAGDGSGMKDMVVWIEGVARGAIGSDVARGTGVARAFEGAYGLQRQGVTRG